MLNTEEGQEDDSWTVYSFPIAFCICMDFFFSDMPNLTATVFPDPVLPLKQAWFFLVWGLDFLASLTLHHVLNVSASPWIFDAISRLLET